MEEREKVEEQLEDLDTPAEDAEEVKGGYHWGVSQTGIKNDHVGIGQKVRPGGLDGTEHQHNETLVRI
jgi:hypothetical protein